MRGARVAPLAVRTRIISSGEKIEASTCVYACICSMHMQRAYAGSMHMQMQHAYVCMHACIMQEHVHVRVPGAEKSREEQTRSEKSREETRREEKRTDEKRREAARREEEIREEKRK